MACSAEAKMPAVRGGGIRDGLNKLLGMKTGLLLGDYPPIMENQMEKKMENEMETGGI